MVIEEGVYARMVATLPLILIAPDSLENVYAPLLLLTPVSSSVNENDTSTPNVFVMDCGFDTVYVYVGVGRTGG
jgi:hypothetical protein